MIDMTMTTEARAAAAVDQQDAEARQQRIREETFRIEHSRMMATTAASMVDATERAKQVRQSRHAAAVIEARVCRDHRDLLAGQRLKVETDIGALRAFLLETEKARARTVMSGMAEEFPTQAETESFRRRLDEYDRERHRLQAMIQTGVAELGRAQASEDDANSVFQRAADLERKAKNEL